MEIFSRLQNEDTDRDKLWVIKANGTEKTIIESDFGASLLRGPKWSPDSKKIAYHLRLTILRTNMNANTKDY